MSQSDRKPMDSSKPTSLYLRSTSAVSLNERFSQVLVEQLTRPRMVTFDPVLLQQRDACVLLMKSETSPDLQVHTRDSAVRLQQRLRTKRRRRRRRRSVWARLGWQQLTHRLATSTPRGFWSFIRKYRWSAAFSSTLRNLHGPRIQHGLLTRTKIHKLTSGRTQVRLHLQRGGATTSRGRGLSREDTPTKKQLDAQLDDYMSMSKSRLDKELDDYMSMTKSRLDAQLDDYMSMSKSRLDKELDDYMSMTKSRLDAELDEYMLMAGQTDGQWD